MGNILVVDDDANFTSSLVELIEQQGHSTRVAGSLEAAQAAVAERRPDLLLIDLVLPDGDGLDLLSQGLHAETEVIVLTGHPSVASAVQGLRANVSDYLTKPIDLARFKARLKALNGSTTADGAPRGGNGALADGLHLGCFIGDSPAMAECYRTIERVAPTEASVMLRGESGTGKDLAANAIHRLSKRAGGPFLALNCGAVPESLIGNELFGHERGGYTGAGRQHKGYFERADGGTLFLDEVTETPPELQVNLLRVLETGKLTRLGGEKEIAVDVRLVAATNRDPKQYIAEGKLREDLFYRLNVFPLYLPPLRERREDIAPLAEQIVAELNADAGQRKRLTTAALEYLGEQDWPGNVRELKNAVLRAFILAEHEIDRSRLAQAPSPAAGAGRGREPQGNGATSLDNAEKQLIFDTLERFQGDKKRAAKALGISLKTLYNKLKRYDEEQPSG